VTVGFVGHRGDRPTAEIGVVAVGEGQDEAFAGAATVSRPVNATDSTT